jgi:hypothetical protein
MQEHINMTAVKYLLHMYALQGAIYQYDIDKAIEMEKKQLLDFGSKVAMKAHAGQSGWSIIEVYNENK